MVDPKKQEFWPRINILKGFFFFQNLSMNHSSSKSTKIVVSKSIFNDKNHLNFFQKKLRLVGQKIRWPKPKPINEKLRLRPINRLIGRPLVGQNNFGTKIPLLNEKKILA